MCTTRLPRNLHPSELLPPLDHIHHPRVNLLNVNVNVNVDDDFNDESDHEEEDEHDKSRSDEIKFFENKLERNGRQHVDEDNTPEHCCLSAGEVGCNDLSSRPSSARHTDLLLGDSRLSLNSLSLCLSSLLLNMFVILSRKNRLPLPCDETETSWLV